MLEREERPDKAQRNEHPHEDAGSAWTELEGHNVQPQPEPVYEWLADGSVQQVAEPMMAQEVDPGQYGMWQPEPQLPDELHPQGVEFQEGLGSV